MKIKTFYYTSTQCSTAHFAKLKRRTQLERMKKNEVA